MPYRKYSVDDSQILYKKLPDGTFDPCGTDIDGFCTKMDELPILIVKEDGMTMYAYEIDVDFAPLEAAFKLMQEDISKLISEESRLMLNNDQSYVYPESVTEAYKALEDAMGESKFYLQYPSSYDIARRSLNRIKDRVKDVIKNPAVAAARDQYLMMLELAYLDQEKKVK